MTAPGRALLLADATTRDIEELLAPGPAAALLPVGSTEAHGPHLPLNTDVVIAQAAAWRAALRLAEGGARVAVLPPVAYAVCEFAGAFAGTVSVRAETVAGLIQEIAQSLFRQGFDPLVLVNGHLEPEHGRMLKEVAREVSARGPGSCRFADQRRPPTVAHLGEEFGRGGGHAGSYETSLVLAARPDLVRDAARAALPANFVDIAARLRQGAVTAEQAGGPQGYFGDPASASVAEGERLLDVLAAMVVDCVLSPERAPS